MEVLNTINYFRIHFSTFKNMIILILVKVSSRNFKLNSNPESQLRTAIIWDTLTFQKVELCWNKLKTLRETPISLPLTPDL